jgi:hypothetical protein
VLHTAQAPTPCCTRRAAHTLDCTHRTAHTVPHLVHELGDLEGLEVRHVVEQQQHARPIERRRALVRLRPVARTAPVWREGMQCSAAAAGCRRGGRRTARRLACAGASRDADDTADHCCAQLLRLCSPHVRSVMALLVMLPSCTHLSMMSVSSSSWLSTGRRSASSCSSSCSRVAVRLCRERGRARATCQRAPNQGQTCGLSPHTSCGAVWGRSVCARAHADARHPRASLTSSSCCVLATAAVLECLHCDCQGQLLLLNSWCCWARCAWRCKQLAIAPNWAPCARRETPVPAARGGPAVPAAAGSHCCNTRAHSTVCCRAQAMGMG